MDKVKAFFVGVMSAIMSALGVLAVPIFMLVGCNLIDYVTGIISAHYRNEEISSYKGIKGIAKKVGMWLLVLIGSWLDVLIQYAVENTGVQLDIPFIIATVVAVWLVVNEMISILENLIDIGVPMPPFLMPIVKYMKKKVEESAKVEEEEEQDEQ